MKIISVAQKSDEWFKARAGLVTASGAKALLTPLFKVKDSKAVDTYLSKRLAEKWLGGPLLEEVVNALPMEYGSILESEARPRYTLLTDQVVQEVGLITDDDGVCGASPDGLIGDDCGIEIKCPNASTHIRYLLAGKVPDDYVVQVFFSMFVTGFSRWVFMSYRRGMPDLILTVNRDEKIMGQIEDAVENFKSKLDTGWKTLIALNDGKPPIHNKTVAEVLAEERALDGDDTNDVPTP